MQEDMSCSLDQSESGIATQNDSIQRKFMSNPVSMTGSITPRLEEEKKSFARPILPPLTTAVPSPVILESVEEETT